ncbi:MAG: 50S ribosomal protein L29 [Myxococcales bacterium]|nr:50S ribosomal protein L29 [Myxococcales bacterium]
MKIQEIREKTTEELRGVESDLRRELWKSRFENHTGQLDDTAKLAGLRRSIARVKTILTERQHADAQGAK